MPTNVEKIKHDNKFSGLPTPYIPISGELLKAVKTAFVSLNRCGVDSIFVKETLRDICTTNTPEVMYSITKEQQKLIANWWKDFDPRHVKELREQIYPPRRVGSGVSGGIFQ